VTARVALTKMHGACNDFVILDRRTARVDDVRSFARWACNRREGVGADGLIAIDPSNASDATMRTFNADGSEAEMCGNGVRCAARWLDEAGAGDRLEFETAAGVVRTEVVAREPEYLVRVRLGTPHVELHPGEFFGDAVVVDIGNPHVVLFVDDVDAADLEALAAGFQIARGYQQNGIAVDDIAACVGQHTAVRIAVEGYSQVCSARLNFARHEFGMQRAAVCIDVAAVGRSVQE